MPLKRIPTLLLLLWTGMLSAQSIDELEKIAGLKMANSDFKEALENYRKAIDRVSEEGSHATTFAYAGMCALQLGDEISAKTYFMESVKRGIEEPMIFDELAGIAKKENDYDTQIFAYKAGLERSPADLQKYQLKLCSVYKKQKDGDKLLTMSKAILSYDCQNTKALEYKGTAYQYQKMMTEAKATFEAIYNIDSTNINAHIFLGNYSYQVGKNKLNAARKKYNALSKPTRLEWHEHNEQSKATMEKYYRPAIKHLELVYAQKPNPSIKKMLFTMYTKLGEREKAMLYE